MIQGRKEPLSDEDFKNFVGNYSTSMDMFLYMMETFMDHTMPAEVHRRMNEDEYDDICRKVATVIGLSNKMLNSLLMQKRKAMPATEGGMNGMSNEQKSAFIRQYAKAKES